MLASYPSRNSLRRDNAELQLLLQSPKMRITYNTLLLYSCSSSNYRITSVSLFHSVDLSLAKCDLFFWSGFQNRFEKLQTVDNTIKEF